jgi:hypothetical protein
MFRPIFLFNYCPLYREFFGHRSREANLCVTGQPNLTGGAPDSSARILALKKLTVLQNQGVAEFVRISNIKYV